MTATNNDLRSRLRQLLAIPERDRTDEEWDEIVGIEIELGPGKFSPQPKSPGAPPGGQNPGQPRQNRPKNHWKPKKPKVPGP